jgi:Domain of unknown function (DUF5134)
MSAPGRLLDIFAAIMLLVAAVSAARLIAGRPWIRAAPDADIDAAHTLMGVAMAGMLVAGLRTLPSVAWEVIFAVLTAWFAWRVYRESRGLGSRVIVRGHHAPHLLHSAGMLYMFAAVAGSVGGSGGMGDMAGAAGSATQALRFPLIALIFAFLLAGYVVLDLDQLPGLARAAGFGSVLAVPVGAGAVLAAAPVAGTDSAVATVAVMAADPAQLTDRDVSVANACPHAAGSVLAWLLSPRTAVSCRVAMGVTMAFMLVIMI